MTGNEKTLHKGLFFLMTAVFFLTLNVPLLYAGSITLQPTIDLHNTKGNLTGTLTLLNQGDESAFSVAPVVRLGIKELRLKKIDALAAGNEMQWSFRFLQPALELGRQGEFPLYFLVSYRDANLYPFSTATVLPVKVGENISNAKISTEVAFKNTRNGAEIDVRLNNPLLHTTKGALNVFTSKELYTEEAMREFTLQPGKSMDFSFTVHNTGALPGSSYQIFAVTETIAEKYQATDIQDGMIQINVPREQQKSNTKPWVFAALGLLFLLTLAIELKKWKRST